MSAEIVSIRLVCEECKRKGDGVAVRKGGFEEDLLAAGLQASQAILHRADCATAKENGYKMEAQK